MDKSNIVMGVMLAAVVGVFVYAVSGFFNSSTASNAPAAGNNLQLSSGMGLGKKTSDDTSVSVDITPKAFEAGRLYLDIGVNTHSVELSEFDLKKMTVLEAYGKKISPQSAPELTGHHNSGALVFNTGELPDTFRITITGLPEIKERVFVWP